MVTLNVEWNDGSYLALRILASSVAVLTRRYRKMAGVIRVWVS